MSAPKYTPGPWDACEDEPSVGGRRDGWAIHIAACGVEQGHEKHTPLEEAYANARLIAAAPDLLAACQRVLAELEDGITMGCEEDLREAVAKAEGRE